MAHCWSDDFHLYRVPPSLREEEPLPDLRELKAAWPLFTRICGRQQRGLYRGARPLRSGTEIRPCQECSGMTPIMGGPCRNYKWTPSTLAREVRLQSEVKP